MGAPRTATRAAPTPAEAAEGAEFVVMCVGNDDDVRDGDARRRRRARRDGGRVDRSSTTRRRRPALARELAAACAERGVGFVDAPVSGGQAGAENGQLTVMCGGDDEAVFDAAAAGDRRLRRSRASGWARPAPGS